MSEKPREVPDEFKPRKKRKTDIALEGVLEPEQKPERSKGIFYIKSFLSEPRNYEEYDEIMFNADTSAHFDGRDKDAFFSSYGEDLKEELTIKTHNLETEKKQEQALLYLRKKITGKVLVDLGAGNSEGMMLLAKELGAKVYIRVDKFSPEGWGIHLDPTQDLSEGKTEGQTQIVTVKADMLDFLSRLPDESVCMSINGIDYAIIDYLKFHKAVILEILRVTEKGGVILGNNSVCLISISNTLNPKLIEEEKDQFTKDFFKGKTLKNLSDEEKKNILESHVREIELPFFKGSLVKIFEKDK